MASDSNKALSQSGPIRLACRKDNPGTSAYCLAISSNNSLSSGLAVAPCTRSSTGPLKCAVLNASNKGIIFFSLRNCPKNPRRKGVCMEKVGISPVDGVYTGGKIGLTRDKSLRSISSRKVMTSK